MTTSSVHPDHAGEQAYIERVHRAELASRERATRAAEMAPDKISARKQRERAMNRLKQMVDPEKLCFGAITRTDGKKLYIGRGAVHDGTDLLVVNWRLPVVSAFYEASASDPCGLDSRRRFQIDELRLRRIIDDQFADRPAAPRQPRPPVTRPVVTRRDFPKQPPPTRSEREEPASPPDRPEVVPATESHGQPSSHPRQRDKPEAGPPEHITPPPSTARSPEPLPPGSVKSMTDDAAERAVASPTDREAPDSSLSDAILADMDRARGAEMRDIVATIERRQYELISDDIDGVLVIQGGPGSGKTAIALHRAAWLLYNHRESLERAGTLIVGPNPAFMDYVKGVLPALGESAVTQKAVDRVIDAADLRVRAEEPAPLARLKGDPRMTDVIDRAVRARVRWPTSDTELAVDRVRVTLRREEMDELVASARADDRSYLAGRAHFHGSLDEAVYDRIRARRTVFRSGPDDDQISRAVTRLADTIWPSISAAEVVRDLLNSRARIDEAGVALTPEERGLMYRPRATQIGDEPWTSADIALLDDAQAAIGGDIQGFGYVLVDEAQDLSPMQLRMIKRRAHANRMTLVGDIAQSTGAWRYPDWADMLELVGLQHEGRIAELAIGYRVPAQIMDLASELLPRIAPDVVATRAVRLGAEDPRLVQTQEATIAADAVAEARRRIDGDRSLGIIVPERRLEDMRAALNLAAIEYGDIVVDSLSRPLTLLSAVQAKGLEFDHVVVVEPTEIAGPDNDWARLYVALTRATRTLSVLYSTVLPFEHGRPVIEAPEDEHVTLPDLPPPAERLGPRYTEALMRAKFVHDGQSRRGTSTPYFAHLQAVSALVLEDGGSEDEAIAALLHDTVEDHGTGMLAQIEDQFGTRVAEIVLGCTDPDNEDDLPWRELKTQHLRQLEAAGPLVRRVSLAEKLDNARALLRDYRRLGDGLWERMHVDPEDLLWYVAELADLFTTQRPGDMASELRDTVNRLMELASSPSDAQRDATDDDAVPLATSR